MRWLLVPALLFLVVPPVDAGTTPLPTIELGDMPTVLYAHMDPDSDSPLSTVPPPSGVEAIYQAPASSPTLTCLPGGLSTAWNSMWLFPTPNAVDYDGRVLQPSAERGTAGDIQFSGQSTLYWYVESTPLATVLPALPIPDLHVRATVRTGVMASPDHVAMDNGDILAVADVSATLSGSSTTAPGVKFVGTGPSGGDLYEFALPLALGGHEAAAKFGFNIRVDAFLDNPLCSGPSQGAILPPNVAFVSVADHRPRLETNVHNALRVLDQLVYAQRSNVTIKVAYTDVWGPASVRITDASFMAPGAAEGTPMEITNLVSAWHPFGNETPRRFDEMTALPEGNGPFVARVTFQVDQAQAPVVLDIAVQLPAELKESPGIAPLAVLAVLALGALLRRK